MSNKLLMRHEILTSLAEILSGKVSDKLSAQLNELLAVSQMRIELGEAAVSVAFAGGTGVGKSSLFNAVLGTEQARVSAIRPTTVQAHAVSDINAQKLLDWLGIEARTENLALREEFGISAKNYQGLAVIDLPDIDSTNEQNRELAAYLTKRVDVLIWVLDPQKYADAILHDQYLAQVSANAKNILFVMNKIDILDATEREAVIADAQRLIQAFAVKASVLGVSAQLGVGITDLKQRIADVAANKALKAEVIQNQYAYLVSAIREELQWQDIQFPDSFSEAEKEAIIAGLHSTFGTDAMLAESIRTYNTNGRKVTSWIFSRPFIRRRLNPLNHLQKSIVGNAKQDSESAVKSRNADGFVAESKSQVSANAANADINLQNAIDRIVNRRLKFLPPLWQKEILAQLATLKTVHPADLAKVKWQNRAAWWGFANMLQWLFFLTFLLGLGWQLLYLFGAAIGVILPQPPVWGYFTLPLIMVVSGLLLGIITSSIAAFFIRRGALRQKRKIIREVTNSFETQVDEFYVAKIAAAFKPVQTAQKYLEQL